MQVRVKINVGDPEGRFFLGSGIARLLEGIDRQRSISRAAKEMDLSYPKALRMIQKLEAGLDRAIVARRRGGNARGGAELTPAGRDILRRYGRLERRIHRYADAAFEEVFSKPLAGDSAP